MTNYQKAIKVRKVCETRESCSTNDSICPYKEHCLKSKIIIFEPIFIKLKVIAKAIVIEKWNVK